MKKIILTALLVPAMALAQTYPSPTFNSVTLQNPLTPANGGTGVANSNTITLGGNLTTSGANPLTLTTTGSTNITLPTSGTLLNSTSGATAGANSNITSLSGLTTPLSVPQGGTGSATATGTGSVVLSTSPSVSGLTVTGSLTATGLVTIADLAAQAANTVLANATASTATPTAFAMPSCSTSASALNWTAGSGFTCNTAVVASNVSGTVSIANGGTNAVTAAAALTNLGADAVGSTTNKDAYVSTAGNDSNNGTSWGYAKLTLQAAINAANPGGIVHVGAGTYNLTSSLAMQPNVTVSCAPGATITQANGQNLSVMIDWSANSANGAGFHGCVIDGNRSGNTDNANAIMLYVSTASDVVITNNTIKNGTGDGIVVTTGLRPVISYNRMSNFYVGPIYLVTGVGQTATYGQINHNTLYGNIGQHAITANNSDRNVIVGNTINAALQTGTVVNTSGTTITWVSGPNFSAVSPGSFIIFNGGTELLVTAVNSSTSLTVNATAGTLTSVPAAFGPGDLISILSASYNTIANNEVFGGVGGGVVISNFVAGSSTQKNQVIGNTLRGQGEGCIEIESENVFGTQVFDNQIRGNSISNCGVGGSAVAANTKYGIALIDFNPNTLLNTFIDGNYVRDDQGSPTTSFWLGLTSIATGQVFVGKNTGVGMANAGVAGGIVSVSLGASWGSSATATATSYGDAFLVNVTSNGTGQAANATVTVNTAATTAENPPVMACQFVNGSGIVNFAYAQTPGVNTAPSLALFVFSGTPTAGNTYNFLCRG